VLTETNIENARVKLSFCHTSENTVYSRFLHVAESVKKTQATMLKESKYHKERVAIFILFVLTQKIFKMRA